MMDKDDCKQMMSAQVLACDAPLPRFLLWDASLPVHTLSSVSGFPGQGALSQYIKDLR